LVPVSGCSTCERLSLSPTDVIASPTVTHLRYRVVAAHGDPH
jgi:hypothetical protein